MQHIGSPLLHNPTAQFMALFAKVGPTTPCILEPATVARRSCMSENFTLASNVSTFTSPMRPFAFVGESRLLDATLGNALHFSDEADTMRAQSAMETQTDFGF
jgi:hypothetical protein